MPIVVRSILALLVGIAVGGGVNMGLVVLGPSLIPPPAGVDMTSAEGISAAMQLLQPRHFVMPFLAHALGTLVGALAGGLLSQSHRTWIAYGVGAMFLLGGISASFMIPAPVWFVVLDLVAAYIPMAWLGLQFANRMKPLPAGGEPSTPS